jgi:hypothetical protein
MVALYGTTNAQLMRKLAEAAKGTSKQKKGVMLLKPLPQCDHKTFKISNNLPRFLIVQNYK